MHTNCSEHAQWTHFLLSKVILQFTDWKFLQVSPLVMACWKQLELAFYTTPMARQKLKGWTTIYRLKVLASISSMLWLAESSRTWPSILPQWRGKKDFLPRHWGSIEGSMHTYCPYHARWTHFSAVQCCSTIWRLKVLAHVSSSWGLPEEVGPVLLYYPNGEAKNRNFLPRHWGSIEGQVLIPILTLCECV